MFTGIELEKGMREEQIEAAILEIFHWFKDHKCFNIGKNYRLGPNRYHLYTRMRPIILMKIFNIKLTKDLDDIDLVFFPKMARDDIIFIDDHIDDVWVDDIYPVDMLVKLFKRWYINSIIDAYLDQDILHGVKVWDRDEFFILLKEELDKEFNLSYGMLDHGYPVIEASRNINRLFESTDRYIETALYHERGIIL